MILTLRSECPTPLKNKELVALLVNSEACVARGELSIMSSLKKSVAENILP